MPAIEDASPAFNVSIADEATWAIVSRKLTCATPLEGAPAAGLSTAVDEEEIGDA